jgi:methionyl aminopeptidase
MIMIKNKTSIRKMHQAGQLLAGIFEELETFIRPGIHTSEIDSWIEKKIKEKGLVSRMKGYMGYKHVSCISVNDEVVHGIPHKDKVLKKGDLVKIDICASWQGYCADMARSLFIGDVDTKIKKLVSVAQQALDKGIEQAQPGKHLTDISSAIQTEVERHGYGVVRDFAGHGIGKKMHEDPEVLNFGKPGKGPILRPGMALALEPMITMGNYEVYIADDGWTVKTVDKSLAAHVEDTVVITENGPCIITRANTGIEHELNGGL